MIKKTILIFTCFIFLFACGKKEEPEYKAKKNHILNNKI